MSSPDFSDELGNGNEISVPTVRRFSETPSSDTLAFRTRERIIPAVTAPTPNHKIRERRTSSLTEMFLATAAGNPALSGLLAATEASETAVGAEACTAALRTSAGVISEFNRSTASGIRVAAVSVCGAACESSLSALNSFLGPRRSSSFGQSPNRRWRC